MTVSEVLTTILNRPFIIYFINAVHQMYNMFTDVRTRSKTYTHSMATYSPGCPLPRRM